MQLSWNYNYGMFSKVLVKDIYDSKMTLLDHPEEVAHDPFVVFSSALWFYMTPQSPKPSMHEIATGFMEPTQADRRAGIQAGFGATINIINGAYECGGRTEKAGALNRIKYYKAFLNHFHLPEGEAGLGCAGQHAFPTGGYGDVVGYFSKGWSHTPSCTPVKW